jgi:hypothetical protein
MEKFWTPFFIIFTVVFLTIGGAIYSIPYVVVGLTGKVIVEEIFKTPEPSPAPIVEIPPSDHAKLEANGVQNCQVRPVPSSYPNKIKVKVNGHLVIVFCDPNNMYLSSCCYNN